VLRWLEGYLAFSKSPELHNIEQCIRTNYLFLLLSIPEDSMKHTGIEQKTKGHGSGSRDEGWLRLCTQSMVYVNLPRNGVQDQHLVCLSGVT
jgi:hypothetical protein